jgi:hypothetical protein
MATGGGGRRRLLLLPAMARAREFRNICQKQWREICPHRRRLDFRQSIAKKFSPLNAGNPLKSQDSEERILGKERKNKTQIQGKARNGK